MSANVFAEESCALDVLNAQKKPRVRRSLELRAQIVRDSYEVGVAAAAQKHCVQRTQISYWRRLLRSAESSAAGEIEKAPDFVPVVVEEGDDDVRAPGVSVSDHRLSDQHANPAEDLSQPDALPKEMIVLEFGGTRLLFPLDMGVKQLAKLVHLLEVGQ